MILHVYYALFHATMRCHIFATPCFMLIHIISRLRHYLLPLLLALIIDYALRFMPFMRFMLTMFFAADCSRLLPLPLFRLLPLPPVAASILIADAAFQLLRLFSPFCLCYAEIFFALISLMLPCCCLDIIALHAFRCHAGAIIFAAIFFFFCLFLRHYYHIDTFFSPLFSCCFDSCRQC